MAARYIQRPDTIAEISWSRDSCCNVRRQQVLKMYFPQVFDWLDEVGSKIVVEFLERWPNLDKLQRARPATIERFFIDHNSRKPESIASRFGRPFQPLRMRRSLPPAVPLL